MYVRRARAEGGEPLVEVWERSVRASHHFLTESDIAGLRAFVREAFANVGAADGASDGASDGEGLWVLLSPTDTLMGFLGYAHDSVEALFIDPAFHRQGGGKFLIDFAQEMSE